jgi:hypothetical protein
MLRRLLAAAFITLAAVTAVSVPATAVITWEGE